MSWSGVEAGKSSLSLGMDKRARDGYNAIKCEGKKGARW